MLIFKFNQNFSIYPFLQLFWCCTAYLGNKMKLGNWNTSSLNVLFSSFLNGTCILINLFLHLWALSQPGFVGLRPLLKKTFPFSSLMRKQQIHYIGNLNSIRFVYFQLNDIISKLFLNFIIHMGAWGFESMNDFWYTVST